MKRVLCALKNLIKKIKNEKKDEPKNQQNVLCNLNYILKQIEKLSPCCNMKKLSCETDGFTKINGQSVPGTLAPLVDTVVLLDICNAAGQRVRITKGTRKAGTRVGIHVHKFGGYTLILSGQMTDYVQGLPVKKYGPNSGYYMPPCTPMSAANLGTEDVELIDIFVGEPCEPFIEIMEPNWTFDRVGRFDGGCNC